MESQQGATQISSQPVAMVVTFMLSIFLYCLREGIGHFRNEECHLSWSLWRKRQASLLFVAVILTRCHVRSEYHQVGCPGLICAATDMHYLPSVLNWNFLVQVYITELMRF